MLESLVIMLNWLLHMQELDFLRMVVQHGYYHVWSENKSLSVFSSIIQFGTRNKHNSCSQRTISIAEDAGKAMGKTTILVKDVPGFATSRLGVALGNEAIRMLADGVASAKDIDTAMELGYRHPMGPLALSDLVGLDVRRDILLNLAKSFDDDSYLPHPLLDKLVADGRLGKKSGKGIYDWSSGKAEESDL